MRCISDEKVNNNAASAIKFYTGGTVMNKGMTGAITGITMGIVAGTAAYMIAGGQKKFPSKQLKRSANRAVRAVGSAINNVSSMMQSH